MIMVVHARKQDHVQTVLCIVCVESRHQTALPTDALHHLAAQRLERPYRGLVVWPKSLFPSVLGVVVPFLVRKVDQVNTKRSYQVADYNLRCYTLI